MRNRVAPSRVEPRHRVTTGQKPVPARTITFPAPSSGWVTNANLGRAVPAAARVLENWFPTQRGCRLRGGSAKRATISTGPVTSLMTYRDGAGEQFFAADATTIADITVVADPDVIPTKDVTGQTSGEYSYTNFTNTAGSFMFCVNGDDDMQRYDGTSWLTINAISTPAITGAATADFTHVWSYAQSLFFIEGNSLKAWSLPANAVGGALVEIDLGGVFSKGGTLLFGAAISSDSGTGFNERCVFVTNRGEFAIYEGTDPATASTWSIVGLYEMSPPMGKNAHMRVAGDILVATEDGLVSLLKATTNDRDALKLDAVSVPIEPNWLQEVDRRGATTNKKWELLRVSTRNMAIVALPTVASENKICFAVNLQSGAWCNFTWDTNCVGLFSEIGFFGTDDGEVLQMESGGEDNSLAYTATWIGHFEDTDQSKPGHIRHCQKAILYARSDNDMNPNLGINTDYNEEYISAPASISDFTNVTWGSFTWGQFTWGATAAQVTKRKRQSVNKSGVAIAPQVRVTSGTTPAQFLELAKMDVIYDEGQSPDGA